MRHIAHRVDPRNRRTPINPADGELCRKLFAIEAAGAPRTSEVRSPIPVF